MASVKVRSKVILKADLILNLVVTPIYFIFSIKIKYIKQLQFMQLRTFIKYAIYDINYRKSWMEILQSRVFVCFDVNKKYIKE